MNGFDRTQVTLLGRRPAFLILAVGLAMGVAIQAQAAPQVPLQRGDAQRTGRSPYECPRSPRLSWIYTMTLGCSASPVVAGNGTVYFGSYDKNMYAVSAAGAETWRFQSNSVIKSGAGIGSDGTIYFGTSLGSLYALRPDGSSKWASPFSTGSQSLVGPMLIGAQDQLYIASENKKIYSISADGAQTWSYNLGVTPKQGLAASPDGSVLYVPGSDGCIYAVNSNGSLRWKSANVTANNVCAVGDDGVVYVGGTDNRFYALNPNGSVKWNYATGGRVSTGAAVGLDGTLYFGSQDRRLYAIRSDGTLKWSHTAQEAIYSAPTLDAYGTLVFGTMSGDLSALNASDGSSVWSFQLGAGIYTSPVVAGDGSVYIIDSGGMLSAFNGWVAHPDIPEPSSVVVLATALMGLALSRRRKA